MGGILDSVLLFFHAHPILSAVGALVVTFAFYAGRMGLNIWSNSRSPLRCLPGPKTNPSIIYGHLRQMMMAEDNSVQQSWVKEHGRTLAVRGPWGKWMLLSTDTRAIQHVTYATHVYHKPPESAKAIASFLGHEGVLTVEGKSHRNQRRVMNPAFGFAQLRGMFDIFLEKSLELRDTWNARCSEAGGTVTVDCLQTLSHATLDIIGKAGFGYDFNALGGGSDELLKIFEQLFRKDPSPAALTRNLVGNIIPFYTPPDVQARVKSRAKMNAITAQLVQEKKRAILASLGTSGKLVKEAMDGKDLLSLLLQANLAEDLPAEHKMSDEEVTAQIPTFIVAGHETTASTMTWALYTLATQSDVQQKLRDELMEVGSDMPSLEELNALPYLEAVVRETLRLHNIVTFVTREAVADDIIPLSEPVVLNTGEVVRQIQVRKGDMINVPIRLVNHDNATWGSDGDKFRPERWQNIPSAASAIPGITPNLFTFIGGPRACIGHRFAVAEMKALLFHLVRAFEFSLAVEPGEIYSKSGSLIRPLLRESNKVSMPLILHQLS
ncbi:cytochrome P450 [Auriculariales sp. MPI-PUGE-AT-0066]|nr:cytochrome P450 [Auriculariales sp. MPI-PUGE-AT-0066]